MTHATLDPIVHRVAEAIRTGRLPRAAVAKIRAALAAKAQELQLVVADAINEPSAPAPAPVPGAGGWVTPLPGATCPTTMRAHDDAAAAWLRSTSAAAPRPRDRELDALVERFRADHGVGDVQHADLVARARDEWRELRDRRMTSLPLDAYVEHRLEFDAEDRRRRAEGLL